MTKKELALEYHKKGYNCAQAVACAFCEELGVSETDRQIRRNNAGVRCGAKFSSEVADFTLSRKVSIEVKGACTANRHRWVRRVS